MEAWYEHTARCSDLPAVECMSCHRPLFASESRRIGLCVPCERSNPNLGKRRHRFRRQGAST
jgi:hypothetical protein